MVLPGRVMVCPRVEKHEVVPEMGLKRSGWGVNGDRSEHGPESNGDSEVSGFSRSQEELGWQQQTLGLYDMHKTSLYRYVRGLALPVDQVEDVVQETFFRLAQHLRCEGNVENLRSWIFQVAHNLAMDIHRAIRRDHSDSYPEFECGDEPVDPKSNPEWACIQQERIGRLKAAMSRLTRQQYSSVLLRAEGLRYREIASVLGVSEQRAIYLAKRALKRLAEEK